MRIQKREKERDRERGTKKTCFVFVESPLVSAEVVLCANFERKEKMRVPTRRKSNEWARGGREGRRDRGSPHTRETTILKDTILPLRQLKSNRGHHLPINGKILGWSSSDLRLFSTRVGEERSLSLISRTAPRSRTF